MKNIITRYICILLAGVLIFIIGKLLFLGINASMYSHISFNDIVSLIWHGASMDLCMSAYIAAIPALSAIAAPWVKPRVIDNCLKIYFGIVAAAISLCIVLDAGLYSYWQFKLDVTPFSYFFSSPKAAAASAEWWQSLLAFIAWGVWGFAIYSVYSFILKSTPLQSSNHSWKNTFTALFLAALLFIPIRGGVTVSTMNVSRAYFSSDLRLNHAAVNPIFSLLYSATHQDNFDKMYRFFPEDVRKSIFSDLTESYSSKDSIKLLNTNRPDIHLIILESFSSHLMPSLGGEAIAVRLDSIANEGLLWDNFYAGSFRTDRGIPAIISAYPPQPGTSIMKYTSKTDNLPAISKTLAQYGGYDTEYYYGGDINFCNQQAYLTSAGFNNIISDKDFPINQRLSKWGAHDDVLIQKAIATLPDSSERPPLFRVIQTSSSHEPFDVPFIDGGRFTDKRARSFAFADSCVASYIEALHNSSLWDNSLIVLVPDHYGAYPEESDPLQRHRIPLIMTGGALATTGRNNTLGSQIDIAATLLNAMELPHNEFKFSKNLLSSDSPHFAYFADPSYIGWITPTDTTIYNLNAPHNTETTSTKHLKAFLQTLYNDLGQR